MRLFFILLLHLLVLTVRAQGVTISGRIVDAETLDPLPFAHVFFDQTTIGTVSDANGDYVIEHVENGDYKIVFSFVGYEMYFKDVSINGSDVRVSARLVPTKEMLESVEVRGTKDKEWDKQLRQFNRVFFGETEMARDCRILNPWVIDFKIDWDKTFRATASEPLKIENKAMGYSIECTLQGFSFDKKGYKIRGVYKFEEINTLDKKEASKWTRNRRLAYQSSLRFLFKSIIENHHAENGFAIYRDLKPSLQTQTSGYFTTELGKTIRSIEMRDFVQPAGRPGYYQINVPDRLEIHHTTQFTQSKVYRDVSHPVSWIETEKGYILVSQDGNNVNNDHIVTSGELNNNRIASMLPLNYSPGTMVVINYLTKRAEAKRLQERVYVQTDKGFYYPGETIWLKAYTNYANQSVRDSLSRVIYVDLINPSKKIVASRILKLDSTNASGQFEISPNDQPGIYFIRAYTKWILNYGPEVIYYKPVGILRNDLAIKSHEVAIVNNDFSISVLQNKLNGSGKLELKALLDSTDNNFMANCSIAVSSLDLQLPYDVDIYDALQFPDEMPGGTLADFKYPLEYGFSIHGLLYRTNKKYTSGSITVIQGKMDSVYNFRTDRKGNFILGNLNFSDTVTFSFQARDKKNRIFGNTKLIPEETPAIQTPKIYLNKLELDSILLDTPLSLVAEAILDSIPKGKTRINPVQNEIAKTSSNADYVLGASQLERLPTGMHIIDALVGRVPGLQLNSSTGKIFFTGRSSSSSGNEPLLVVDGVPMNMGIGSMTKNADQEKASVGNQQGSQPLDRSSNDSKNSTDFNASGASQSLNNLNSSSNNSSQQPSLNLKDLVGYLTVEYVSRVEVSLKGDARYGGATSNGVIAIYTRKAPMATSEKTINSIIVQGFAKPKLFSPPKFNPLLNQTYNPFTVYWNPSINISARKETKLLFDAPQKPGRYILRIEGMSKEGNPVSGSVILNIDKVAAQTSAQF